MKTAVITGASRGIGAAAACALARAGHRVIINYKSSDEKAKELADKINSFGEAHIFKADISVADDVKKMFEYVEENFGGTDILINNAGVCHIGVFQLMTESEIDRVLDTDLKGAVMASKYALPSMIRKKSGVIVNVSSMWGEVGASCEVVYSAAKAGIIGFTKALSKEVGESGIRVNCISPGVVMTDMNMTLDGGTLDELKTEIPLKRLGTPDEIAAAILFLTSDDASYLNGVVLSANGGMVI